jgi:hypothetical protein
MEPRGPTAQPLPDEPCEPPLEPAAPLLEPPAPPDEPAAPVPLVPPPDEPLAPPEPEPPAAPVAGGLALQTDSSQIVPGDDGPWPASDSQVAWHCAVARTHPRIEPT